MCITTFFKANILVRYRETDLVDDAVHLLLISRAITCLSQLRLVHLVVRFEDGADYQGYLEQLADLFLQLPKLTNKKLIGIIRGEPKFALAEWTSTTGLVITDAALKLWHEATDYGI